MYIGDRLASLSNFVEYDLKNLTIINGQLINSPYILFSMQIYIITKIHHFQCIFCGNNQLDSGFAMSLALL